MFRTNAVTATNRTGPIEKGVLIMSEAMIKGHELFQSLSFEKVEEVSGFAGPKPFKKGVAVFSKGDRGSFSYVVLEGRSGYEVRLCRTSAY